MEASSKDLQKISNIKIAINYNVSAAMANQLYKQVGVKYEIIIVEPAIYESVKQGMSQYTAEELITKRSDVANVILNLLTEKLSEKGITITALNIIDLNFSAEFDAAIEAKQITEQQTIQAQYELEKAKVQNTVLGKDKEIKCEDVVKLNDIVHIDVRCVIIQFIPHHTLLSRGDDACYLTNFYGKYSVESNLTMQK